MDAQRRSSVENCAHQICEVGRWSYQSVAACSVDQAFVQACFVLVDTSDREAMTKADTGGGCPLEEQVMSLERPEQ